MKLRTGEALRGARDAMSRGTGLPNAVARGLLAVVAVAAIATCAVAAPTGWYSVLLFAAALLAARSVWRPDGAAPLGLLAVLLAWWALGGRGVGPWTVLLACELAVLHLAAAWAAGQPGFGRSTMTATRRRLGVLAMVVAAAALAGAAVLPLAGHDPAGPDGPLWLVLGLGALGALAVWLATSNGDPDAGTSLRDG